ATDRGTGSGWVADQLPFLIQQTSSKLIVVTSGINARYYDKSGSNWVARDVVQDTLASASGGGEYVFTDTAGDVIRFTDFSTSLPSNERGAFKSFTDADGNVASVTSWTSDGKPAEVQWSTTVGGSTYTES